MQINGDTGDKITYAKLLQEIVNIGSGLKRIGVKSGDVVALCSENRYEYLASAIGVVCCGATVTPVNVQYTTGLYCRSELDIFLFKTAFLNDPH